MSGSKSIEIDPLNVETLRLDVEGTAPLICHNKEMVAETLKRRQEGVDTKDLEVDAEEEYRRSLYEMPEHAEAEYGVPSIMFKKSMVRATKATDMSMTDARQAFFVEGTEVTDMVSLIHPDSEPTMREDVVSVGRGSNNDIRYRGQFREWETPLEITYNRSLITAQGVVELLAIAGFGVGIGDWRPQKDGQYGRFEVKEATEQESPTDRAAALLEDV